MLRDGERIVRQSMAIIEYLDETYDGEAKLLPSTARDRARVLRSPTDRVRHSPVNNLRVDAVPWNAVQRASGGARTLAATLDRGGFRAPSPCWRTIRRRACSARRRADPGADLCLVPQVYNASAGRGYSGLSHHRAHQRRMPGACRPSRRAGELNRTPQDLKDRRQRGRWRRRANAAIARQRSRPSDQPNAPMLKGPGSRSDRRRRRRPRPGGS